LGKICKHGISRIHTDCRACEFDEKEARYKSVFGEFSVACSKCGRAAVICSRDDYGAVSLICMNPKCDNRIEVCEGGRLVSAVIL
jgi:hypothetical protein